MQLFILLTKFMMQAVQIPIYMSNWTPERRAEGLIYLGVGVSHWEKYNFDLVEYRTEKK